MYTVKWLDDKEFESLPYPDMDMSLGVADPKLKTAYVRRTGITNLDMFNTFHELEHLEEGHEGVHADHYRNGVYYKDLGGVFQSILPAVGGFLTGGPVGGALGAAGSLFGGGHSKPQQQQAPQQATMNQFNPATSVVPQQSPATSQVGGQGAGDASAGLGAGTIDKVRQLMARQNQSGFYAGREPGVA